MTFTYFTPRRSDVVDDHHGTTVEDPYRWMEDPADPETVAYVEALNAVSRPYLDSLPGRDELVANLTRLWDVPRSGVARLRNGVRVRPHNDGLQQQPVFFISRDGGPEEVLLDPNTLSEDGATAVIVWSLSPDGAHLAYSVADGGSDWQIIKMRRTSDGTDLPETLRFVKFSDVAWHGDGFFYTRYPEQDIHSTGHTKDPSVVFHRLGTSQAEDVTWFHNTEDPDPGYDASVSNGDDYLVLTEWRGTSHKTGLLYKPLDPDAPWTRLRAEGEAVHAFIASHDGSFIVRTDLDAPNGRIVAIPLDRPETMVEMIPETTRPMEGATGYAGMITVLAMEEASHVVTLHGLDGSPGGTVDLPSLGTISDWDGSFSEETFHLQFESFLHPPTALQWRAGEVSPIEERQVDDSPIVAERHRVTSTDGQDVGMFVIRREGAGPGPTELFGYGGFSIALTPVFSPGRLAFIDAGGTVAVANLRGGIENGERWHEQGMLGSKQQVFDDFIACARYLKESGIATKVGIRGGSNGGLLTAATMIQAPEAFDAVVSQVPVTDMLRYQHFTAGRYWTYEYGDAADPDAFEWLIRYSPYHRAGDAPFFPPLLVTTAEGDDRVVPMHALKFIAAVHHAVGGESDVPLLCRVETRAGHGLGKPTTKLIEEAADIYSFLLHHLT